MDHPLRRPEEILAYRSLKQVIATKVASSVDRRPRGQRAHGSASDGEKNIGLLVVIEHGAIVGILSERDCVRRLVLAGKIR